MIAGRVLSGYYLFSKNRCGRYRYVQTLSKERREDIEEVMTELMDPHTDLVENDYMALVKAAKMPPYSGDY